LLTDTDRRSATARLAINLAKAGCELSMVSTSEHPALKTHVIQQVFSYSGLRPLNALRKAIEKYKPALIIPCDDRAVQHLHELHAVACNQGTSGDSIVEVIERSLGAPQSYATVSSRYDLLTAMREEGVAVPETSILKTKEDLRAWQRKQEFPWVLKADGTWGGRGVRMANSMEEAERFFLELSRPFKLKRAIKRLVVNRDPFWIAPWWHGIGSSVIIQAYIQGRAAHCAAFCWKGKVLAGISVEVGSSEGRTERDSVVRVIEKPEMMICAERIARRFGISGFFGLDFMIDHESQAAYLIEMNPRCIPLSHLQLGKGRDLISALWAQLTGRSAPETVPITGNDLIAYFPQAWICKSEFLESSFHDVPIEQPELIQELLTPWPGRSLLFRMLNSIYRLSEKSSPKSNAKIMA